MRSEEDKLLRVPIVVTLGGEEYEIKPLVIKDAREWRKKFAKLLGRLPSYVSTSTDDAASFSNAVDALIVSMPDEMADLFFVYAKDLDREKIESTATEVELVKAIESVLEVAFPLLGGLTGVLRKMAQ